MDFLVRLYAPYLCVGCGREGKNLICALCEQDISRIPPRCYKCRQTSRWYETCVSCKKRSPLSGVYVFAPYEGVLKEAIHTFKYERAQGAARQLSEFLVEVMPELNSACIVTHVPTATQRVRRRGYDHAELLAKGLARKKQLPFSAALARSGQAHQVGSDRQKRQKQMKNAFRVKKRQHVTGKHVVLVDDILTTGATLEEAARTLKKAGAKTVSAIVLAQP